MGQVDMASFWDERAREDPAYFVESRLEYGNADMDAFWASGEEVVQGFEAQLGFAVRPSDAVVEVGCGIGRLTRVLARRAASVRALDVSAEMLDRARAHHPDLQGVEWVLGDGRSLTGVEDRSADGVFSHVVFQHLPDPEITYGYVREMGRVLRPGGWSAFQVSDDPSVHTPRGGLAARIRAAAGRGPKGVRHPAWLGSAIDLPTLRAVAAAAGLRVERTAREGTQYCLVLLRR